MVRGKWTIELRPDPDQTEATADNFQVFLSRAAIRRSQICADHVAAWSAAGCCDVRRPGEVWRCGPTTTSRGGGVPTAPIR